VCGILIQQLFRIDPIAGKRAAADKRLSLAPSTTTGSPLLKSIKVRLEGRLFHSNFAYALKCLSPLRGRLGWGVAPAGRIDSHLGQCNELIEPGMPDHDIVVEEHQKFPACLLQPLIECSGETSILSIGNHSNGHSRSSPEPAPAKTLPWCCLRMRSYRLFPPNRT
jgi:hypothetical protein